MALLAVAGLIACNDASLFDAFSCPQTPPSTFYKLLEIERATHIRANLGDAGPRRHAIDPRNTVELRDRRLQRGHQRADLLSESGHLPIQYLNQLQQQAEQRPMVRRALAREGELQLRALVL